MILRSTLRGLSALALTAALGATLLVPAAATAQEWTADAAHTEVNFSVSHFFTPVSGTFRDFEIDLAYDADNPENSRVTARIDVASIDTGNSSRDDHLRSADWFEAETYPEITFESTSVRANGENELIAEGDLVIRGESRKIELPIKLLGVREIPESMRAMFGGTTRVASFQAGTELDRNDYQVGVGDWAGTLVVGDEVAIEILVEAHLR